MQPLPRNTLTADQVTALLRDAPGLRVSAGLELVDLSLTVLDDLTEVFDGGSVTRQSFATLHGSARLTVEGPLDWGTAILRPYYLLLSPTGVARWNLGCYYTSTPRADLGQSPQKFEIEGYDILDGLASPVGEVYAVQTGAGYLETVEDILIGQGFTQYQIDQTAASSVLPSPRVWEMDDATTWLTVINDLLASIGYAGIWSDWDGRLRIEPYQPPTERPSEWRYEADGAQAMVATARSVTRDLYRAPNRWVFYRANNVDGPPPVEGLGIYTHVNQSTGPTSVDARGGRVITRAVPLDVADQVALVAAAQVTIDADLRLKTTLNLATAPHPGHWHMDRVTLADPFLGPAAECLVNTWTLPLDGGDMNHEWSVLTL